MSVRIISAMAAFFLAAGLCRAQTGGDADLNKAYKALSEKDYDSAIELFRKGLASQPGNGGAHKDLAYTLLKAGENAAARDEFEAAMKLNPKDETAALEFGFLAFETKKAVEARRMFDKLRQSGSPTVRATAEQAFQNIDKPLADGISRWKQALAQSDKPNDLTLFSAHWELAQTAELRDELPLAAEQYEICRKMKPQMGELLLILARVWQQINRVEDARAALIAASRSSESRTAEQALELFGRRYPYPYEFLAALKIDPHNFTIRRELAYLYLAMNDKPGASEQFQQILDLNPKDWQAREQLNTLKGLKTRPPEQPEGQHLLAGTAKSGASPGTDNRAMGIKSLELGYSNDAVKYLLLAHEEEPDDTEIVLKLGWAYNLAKNDKEAKIWFALARKSNNKMIASEATRAYHVVNGDMTPQTTIWTLPMYSSRWNDLFTYGQIKRSVPFPAPVLSRWLSLYVSARFIGDLKSSLIPQGSVDPQYLSESSVILGVGAATKTWHRLTGWVEAGESFKYIQRSDVGAAIPDYRGGVNFAKGFGSLLGSNSGFYYETTADTIYVSRFDKDWLFYSQNRAGRTFTLENGTSFQFLLNGNMVRDVKEEYWANTVEIGPGIKFHPWFLPRNVYFSSDFLRGVYLDNKYNPRRPNYDDVRVSFWYAVTKK